MICDMISGPDPMSMSPRRTTKSLWHNICLSCQWAQNHLMVRTI